MRAVDIIAKTRDKQPLTDEEVKFWVENYTQGNIPDYQAAAWCMAVVLNGLTDAEATALTLQMAHSGDMLDLHGIAPFVVDKHSTGGVGDKTTLVVAPLVAATGLPVGKMSGRGLGFSGGTIDKVYLPRNLWTCSPNTTSLCPDNLPIWPRQTANFTPCET